MCNFMGYKVSKSQILKLKKIGLGIETNGKWHVIPLDKALITIDELWDNVFEYANTPVNI